MKNNLKIVSDLHIDNLKIKYPNIPDHAITTKMAQYKDTTANSLTKSVIKFLEFSGHQAERISSTGRWIQNKNSEGHKLPSGQWIKGSGKKGTADISATILGRSVKIEIKIGKDYQKKHQIIYEESVVNAGGFYIIARSFDNFFDQYTNLIAFLKGEAPGGVSIPPHNPTQ